ncbi:hypothetical protein D9758_014793 [Tetrapyrgos nigripes]|uniref:Uncharacterized protein n=1 Tax=Tetrapyrgos nigripes TaxID=182062 RepID=A0A8H5FFV3_9AGAR|nr:hypothetical protein D9758_014793 [Tetrapyrgos nigripes]
MKGMRRGKEEDDDGFGHDLAFGSCMIESITTLNGSSSSVSHAPFPFTQFSLLRAQLENKKIVLLASSTDNLDQTLPLPTLTNTPTLSEDEDVFATCGVEDDEDMLEGDNGFGRPTTMTHEVNDTIFSSSHS